MRKSLFLLFFLATSNLFAGWNRLGPDSADIGQITFGAQPATIQYALGSHSIYRSQDNAQSWKLIRSFTIGSAIGIVVDPQDENVVYTYFGPTLFVSNDGGAHWNPTGKKSPRFFGMAIDPQNS